MAPMTTRVPLATFNAMPVDAASAVLATCCQTTRWHAEVCRRRPFTSVEELADAASAILAGLGWPDIHQALQAHPRIGSPPQGDDDADRMSRDEQAGVGDTSMTLANEAYEARFGHVFLVSAAGLSGEEILDRLRERLRNDPDREQGIVAVELSKIMRRRLTELVMP